MKQQTANKPGMGPKKHLAAQLLRTWVVEGIPGEGARLAYYLLFAAFPLLILSTAVMAHIQLGVGDALGLLSGLVPAGLLKLAEEYAAYVRTLDLSSLVVTGGAFALWSCWRAVRVLLDLLKHRRRSDEGRKPFCLQEALAALGLTLGLSVVISLALLAVAFFTELPAVLRLAAAGVPCFGWVWWLYALAAPPQTARLQAWRQAFPGALFAGGAWLAATAFFSFWMERIVDLSLMYGSLGTGLLLLLWLQLTGSVLLLGGELNRLKNGCP
ncbi:MAG: YihY/virulence factor BrkB family protein [Clostridia bacterium]|nr:YihY/virulence factor BrkB family protein [Clostridia bacterium]